MTDRRDTIARRPLTDDERQTLRERFDRGDRSMCCGFGEWSPVWVTALPMAPGPLVKIDRSSDLDAPMSVHEARALGVALIEAADYAEYGDA